MNQFLLEVVKTCGEFKDVVQILFFITVGVITVLTYHKAKLTLLQPIRTEIFKEQIKALSEVLNFFVGRGEVKLRNDFGFDQMLDANACDLMDTYVSMFYDVEFKREDRPYGTSKCPSAIISEERLELCDGYLTPEQKEKEPPPDPRTKAALWAKHKHGCISLPSAFSSRKAAFSRICDSPILPSRAAVLLDEYRELVMKNVFLVGELLTECGQELPEKYPNKEAIRKASMDWIQSRFAEHFSHLEPKAKEIVAFVRSYFDADGIISSGNRRVSQQSPAPLPRARRGHSEGEG